MATKVVSSADAWRELRARIDEADPPARIYVAGCAGEPRLFAETLAQNPQLGAGATFHGVWIPGVNRVDWSAGARAETIFLTPELQAGFAARRVEYLPLTYLQAFRRLESAPFTAAIVITAPPDADDRLSLGVSADFSTALLARRDLFKIALVNPEMPSVSAGVFAAREDFDVLVDAPFPLLEYAPPTPSPVFDAIAGHVARVVADGATLQFGLGNVQLSLLKALAGRRRLRVHSGMASEGVLNAVEAGLVDDRPGAVTIGVALGRAAFYARAAADRRFHFASVAHTHALSTLAAIPDLVAVNSAVEVDLFGQANAEFVDGRLVSGAGGLVDFLRGAAASPGGKPVVALASTARNGAVSRITPRLAGPAVSVARADMGFVATEHGLADLRGLSLDARASALIGIADPAHRPSLRAAWSSIEKTL